MALNDLFAHINKYGELTGEYIKKFIMSDKEIPGKLRESMVYSIDAGGKRLRPALLLGTYEMYSQNKFEQALPFAAAVEMIHTYSLIHDDLPSMDDDDTRRGMPSNHVVYGEAGAILAGDALLNAAFECMLENMTGDIIESGKKIEAARMIARSSGCRGMVGGQSLDIDMNVNTAEDVQRINSMKTGALITSAVQAGAILGVAGDRDIEALGDYAHHIGAAFQITDDILDGTADEKQLGKPVKSDEKNKKTTLLSLHGGEKNKQELNRHIKQAQKALEKLDVNTWFLRETAEYIKDRKY